MKTEVIKLNKQKPDKTILKKAAKIIKEGGLVAFPTETVYGIAADFMNKKAIQKLYRVKKRPKDKPLTVHISKFDELAEFDCEMNLFSKTLIEKFWPGPLTLVFKAKFGEKIGIRMPSSKIALEFISLCKTSIVAPSANISGNCPPREAKDVLKDLDGKIDLLLDGGETEEDAESTVIDVSAFPCRILRRGAIKPGRIADVGRRLQHF